MLERATWTDDECERLGSCPSCASAERSMFLTGLTDKVFFTSAGDWTMYRCSSCQTLYLDPRPDQDSIGRAYSSYYTHAFVPPALAWRQSGLKGLLARSVLRHLGYATGGMPGIGALLMRTQPAAVRRLQFSIRHLPPPPNDGSLLDIGCGSGDFLLVAQDLGYRAMGIEPDPSAVEQGAKRGLHIHPSRFPGAGLTGAAFDHITMSHVLEHVHAPREALREALTLLKPGGRLWISLPNADALGLQRYGANWRGLEIPRHLSLFTPSGLMAALEAEGFERVQHLAPEAVTQFYFRQSRAMERNLDPYSDDALRDNSSDAAIEEAEARAGSNPDLAESLTVIAFSPSSPRHDR